MFWMARNCTWLGSRTSILSAFGPLSNASTARMGIASRIRKAPPTPTARPYTPPGGLGPEPRTKKPSPDRLLVRFLPRVRPPQLLQGLPTEPFSAGNDRIAGQALT